MSGHNTKPTPDDLQEIKEIALAIVAAVENNTIKAAETFHGTIFKRGKDNIMSCPGPGPSSFQTKTDDWFLQVAVRVPYGARIKKHDHGTKLHPVPHTNMPQLLPYKDYGSRPRDPQETKKIALAIIAAVDKGEINAAETYSGMILTRGKNNNLPFPRLNPAETKADDWYFQVSVRVPYNPEINEYTTPIANLRRDVIKHNISFFQRRFDEESQKPVLHPAMDLRKDFQRLLDDNLQALEDIKHPEI